MEGRSGEIEVTNAKVSAPPAAQRRRGAVAEKKN